MWFSRVSKATTPQPPPEPCMEQLTWFRDELRDALEAPTASMGEIIELLKAARAALDIACVQPGRFHERILGLRQQVVDAAALAAVNASKAAQCQSTIEDTDKVLDKAGVPFAGCDLRVRIGAVLGAREEA
jgi:hypothetical protein